MLLLHDLTPGVVRRSRSGGVCFSETNPPLVNSLSHLTGGRNKTNVSRGLQPVFVNLQLEPIALRSSVICPHVFLHEPYAIQHALRLAAEAVRELFRVGKRAADALDHPALAADVMRRAAMAGRKGALHLDAVADVESSHSACAPRPSSPRARLR